MAIEIISDHGNQLTQIRDYLEKIKSGNEALQAETGSLRSEQSGQASKIDELIRRVDHLDKIKPHGDKTYETGNRSYDAAVRGLGDTVVEAWNRAFRGKFDDRFERAQTGGTDSQGGVLVPDLVADVMARIPGEAALPELISMQIPMNSDTVKIPTSTAGPSVSYPGENTAPSESAVTFDNPTLTAKTCVAIDTFSEELNEDSIMPVAPILGQLFLEAVNADINSKAFSSTSTFNGIIQEIEAASSPNLYYMGGSSSSGSTNYSTVSFSDLIGLMHTPNTKVRYKGSFVMHSAVFRYIMALKDSQNRPLFVANWATPAFSETGVLPDQWSASPGTLLGRPVYLTDAMPSTSASNRSVIVYGDFKRGHAFGDRRKLAIDFSKEAGFTKFATVLRATRRYAVKTVLTDAFALLRTSNT